MPNHTEFYVDTHGEHRWRIVAGNNRIIADSGEGYKNQRDAAKGLYSAITNTPTDTVAKIARVVDE